MKRALAILNNTTVFQNSIKVLKDYEYDLIKKSTNSKLGKKVTKNTFKDYFIYTLTLIERETCPIDCFHYKDCFGNNMMYAHRIDHKNYLELINRLQDNLYYLLVVKKIKVLLRLHVLGDFFSKEYVLFWEKMLEMFPNLAIYGYTGTNPKSKISSSKNIAIEILRLRNKFGKRFAIRFSNDNQDIFSANSRDIEEPVKQVSFQCPEQEEKVNTCGDCTACWEVMNRRVLFKTH
jgi:hypothetical protein|tara:strand:- start:276 stop:977 length:702 start_codon:yes stop_codon:yes gene_type:complete